MTSTLPEIYRANRELNARTWAFQIYMGGYIGTYLQQDQCKWSGFRYTLPMLTSHFQQCLLYFVVKLPQTNQLI